MGDLSNIKDTLTTIAGIMLAIGGIIVGLGPAGVVVPGWLATVGIVLGAAGAGIIGWAQGKNPNLTKKSETEVANQNAQAKQPK